MTCPDCNREMDETAGYSKEEDNILQSCFCTCGSVFEGILSRTAIYENDSN